MQYKDIDQYLSPFDLVVKISIKVEHNILKPQEEETLDAVSKGDTLALLPTVYWKANLLPCDKWFYGGYSNMYLIAANQRSLRGYGLLSCRRGSPQACQSSDVQRGLILL